MRGAYTLTTVLASLLLPSILQKLFTRVALGNFTALPTLKISLGAVLGQLQFWVNCSFGSIAGFRPNVVER
jgi:hypothetical protein